MLNMYPITSIIRIMIKVSCSIASPPNHENQRALPSEMRANRLPFFAACPASLINISQNPFNININLHGYLKLLFCFAGALNGKRSPV